MNKEDYNVDNWDVTITPSANFSIEKFAGANASAIFQPNDLAPPSTVIPLMMSTKLSLSTASSPKSWRFRAPSLSLRWSGKLQLHFSFSRSRSSIGDNTKIRGQTDCWDILINRQLSFCGARHALSEWAPSSDELAIVNSMKDVAIKLLQCFKVKYLNPYMLLAEMVEIQADWTQQE